MSRKIILRPKALRDLSEIWEYSECRWGAKLADSYIRELHAAITKIADNPGLGSDRGDLRPGLRKAISASHAIYYYHDAKFVRVSRVLHTSMDADPAL